MEKDDRLLRVGVLGCGPVAQAAHFDACRKARNVELYAVCDVAEDLVSTMAAIHAPRRTYTDYDAMLQDRNVEAVLIATADQFHVPLASRALMAGKHVLVEKPLGVSVEECAVLEQLVKQTGLVLQIGNNRRFDPGNAYAQRFVREELGELISIKAWYYDSVHRYTMTDNLQPLMVQSAGARRPDDSPKTDRRRYLMLTHGSHLVDLARFLGGPLTSVRARYSERFDARCWFVDVEFENGALGHLDMLIPARGDYEEGYAVQGEWGSVRGRAPLTWYHKAAHVECYSVRDGTYHRPMGEDAYTYRRQIEAFAATILDGAPQTGATVEDGLAAMRALVAIARSAETGERVALADVGGGV